MDPTEKAAEKVKSDIFTFSPAERKMQKMIFNGALFVFFMSGVLIIAINFFTKQRDRQSSTTLTKALWKFIPETNMQERRMDLTWNCRKLFLLTLVVASLCAEQKELLEQRHLF